MKFWSIAIFCTDLSILKTFNAFYTFIVLNTLKGATPCDSYETNHVDRMIALIDNFYLLMVIE